MLKRALRLSLSLCLLVDVLPQAHAACRAKLRQEYLSNYKEVQSKLRSFFSDQREAPYLAIGVLVELSSGKRVLSIGSYFGNSHDYLLSRMGIEKSPDDFLAESRSGTKVIWGGELAFEKNGEEFILAAFNQTSSTLLSPSFRGPTGTEVANLNDPKNLQDFIMQIDPERKIVPQSLEFNPQKPYLLDVEVPNNESIRHYMGNRIYIVITNLSVLKIEAKNGSLDLKEAHDIVKDAYVELDNIVTKKVFAHLSRMHFKNKSELRAALLEIEKFRQIAAQILKKQKNAQNITLEDFAPILNEATMSSLQNALKKVSDLIHSRMPILVTPQNTFEISN